MLNRTILMGRLTQTPELKTTTSGNSVTSFSIAVDRSYVKPGEERKADFINCVAWRSTAEFICRYFSKGAMIAIEGQLQTRTYQAKDGSNRTATEVVVDSVSFTGERRDNNGSGQQPAQPPQQSGYNQQQYAPQPPQQNGYQQQYHQQAPAPAAYASGAQSDFADMPYDDDLPF